MFAAMQAPAHIVDPAFERLFYGSFAKVLRRSVNAYLKHRGMSPSRFGRDAMDDPGFVKNRLKKARRMRLDSGDRARVFMGEQPFRPLLLCEVRAFMAETGLKPWALGYWGAHNSSFVKRLFEGASPWLQTVDGFRGWMHSQLRPHQQQDVLLAVARGFQALGDSPVRLDGGVATKGGSRRQRRSLLNTRARSPRG